MRQTSISAFLKLIAATVGLCTAPISLAQAGTNMPEATSNEVTPPAAGVIMQPGYAKTIGRMAYVWGWPLVNMINRSASITTAPQPGRLNGVLPVAPRGRVAMLSNYINPGQNFVTCPNQDVVYGLGYFSLDEEPVIAQVPDLGGRFWTYALYDARTDQFGKLGKPHDSKPGFYLLVGPNWNGKVPDGVTRVIRSSTALASAIPRVFMDDTDADRKAIEPVINQIVFYPLSEYDGTMKTVDWRKAPEIPGAKSTGGETPWVVPEKFFDQLGGVLDTVPPLRGEEALYGQFRVLLDAAQKDPAIKKSSSKWPAKLNAIRSTRSSSGSITGALLAMAGTAPPTMPALARTTSTAPAPRNRTCSTTRQRRPNTSIPTTIQGRAAQWKEWVQNHLHGSAGEWLLVANTLQRASLLQSKSAGPVFIGDEEQGYETQ